MPWKMFKVRAIILWLWKINIKVKKAFIFPKVLIKMVTSKINVTRYKERKLNMWVTIKEVNNDPTTWSKEINGKEEILIGPIKVTKVGMVAIKATKACNGGNQGNQRWNGSNQGNRSGTSSQQYQQKSYQPSPYNNQGQSSGDSELRGLMERMIKNQGQSDKEIRETN
ncbi:hypothetical protein KY289_016709 [Solanum tuberosum]|nr:hypothetical protein KY289_016709 [Solanum tuberosum]